MSLAEATETTVDYLAKAAGEDGPRPRRRRLGTGISSSVLLLAVPAVLLYAFVVLFPTAQGGVLAFTNWDGLSQTYDFIGFKNFVRIFTTESSLNALKMTLIFAISITVLQNGIGLLLALGVNNGLKSRNFLRVLFFAPVVITPVVVAYLWKFILTPDGVLNSTLRALGMDGLAQSWLGNPTWAAVAVIMVVVWQHSGYSMVIYLAGLQSIPDELFEAAEVDGAGPWKRFLAVTWPLLAPATTINVLLTLIGGLKMFSEVFVLTGGGPGGATETLSTLLYKSAFQFNEFGYGIAMAIVLAVVVLFFAGIQQYVSRPKDN